MSRVRTNAEIEEILNLTSIDGVEFTKEQIILLFDEIDVGSEALKKRQAEDACTPTPQQQQSQQQPTPQALLTAAAAMTQPSAIKPTDAICLGTLLSRLDGVGSYNGIIIVATTNCIDQLSPAIYRHGRLNPVQFDYMKQSDMIKMIENFYSTQLTDEQILKLPTYECEITPASMRHYLEQYMDSLPRLIDFLQTRLTIMKAAQAAANLPVMTPPQGARKSSGMFDYIKL